VSPAPEVENPANAAATGVLAKRGLHGAGESRVVDVEGGPHARLPMQMIQPLDLHGQAPYLSRQAPLRQTINRTRALPPVTRTAAWPASPAR